MSLIASAPLVLRRRHGGIADLLPVTGFAASTGILATVLGGLGAFVRRGDSGTPAGGGGDQDLAASLVLFAIIATAMLVPAAMGLGGAAARLSLSRRERDLAAVRLVGGTSAQVGTLAVADVVGQALVGSLVGLGLHVAWTPLLTLLDFGMAPFRATELFLPWWGYPTLLVAAVALAALSAGLGLTGVIISPLGVARDARVVRMSVIRVVVWGALLGGFFLLFQGLSAVAEVVGPAAAMVLIIGFIALIVGSVNIIGPFVVWVVARIVAAAAPSPALLVGARRLAADPRAGWRSVSGITLGLVVAGGLSFLSFVTTGSSTPEEVAMGTALTTGGLLTLGIAAVLAAVSTGVTQTSRLLDQAVVYRAQYVAGAPVSALQRARLAEIGIPLAIAALIALLNTAGLLLPVLSGPQFLEVVVQYVLAAGGSLLLVVASVAITAPLVARIARRPA